MIITQEAESQDGDPDERQTEEPGLHLSLSQNWQHFECPHWDCYRRPNINNITHFDTSSINKQTSIYGI